MADDKDRKEQGEDDVLDLDWSDLDADEGGSDQLVVELGDTSGAAANSTTPPPPDDDQGVPMIRQGVCPRCGYALRPLEEVCPRCHVNVRAAQKEAAKEASVAPSPPPPPPGEQPPTEPAPAPPPIPAPQPRRHWLGCALGLLLVAVIAGVVVYVWETPGMRAGREYRAGLREQLLGHFATARSHYLKALKLEPTMGLAAFSIGTTYLRIGDPGTIQSVEQLSKQAVWGQTHDLQLADDWFREALRIGRDLPPNRRLMDQRINTPARLRAFARAMLAFTALIRASAALQSDHLDDGMAWLTQAGQEAQRALGQDPGNQQAERILRATAGL